MNQNESLVRRLNTMDLTVAQRARLHQDLNKYYRENKGKKLVMPCASVHGRPESEQENFVWTMETVKPAPNEYGRKAGVILTTRQSASVHSLRIRASHIPDIVDWLKNAYQELGGGLI